MDINVLHTGSIPEVQDAPIIEQFFGSTTKNINILYTIT